MALFKVYHGDKSDIPPQLKNEYGYIIVNEEADGGTWIPRDSEGNPLDPQTYGIGEWYIDTDTKRYRIAAAELVDEEGNLYSLDDIVQKDNLVDDFAAAAYDSTHSQSNIPVGTQAEIRASISVAKDEDSITKAYSITVQESQWQQDLVRTGYYKNTVGLAETMHCGASSASIPVPPLIMWSGIGSKATYNVIEDAELNDAKNAITFYISNTNFQALSSAETTYIILIDHR